MLHAFLSYKTLQVRGTYFGFSAVALQLQIFLFLDIFFKACLAKRNLFMVQNLLEHPQCVCVPEMVLALRLVLFPMFYLLDMLSTFPIQQKKVNPFHEITNVSNLC